MVNLVTETQVDTLFYGIFLRVSITYFVLMFWRDFSRHVVLLI
jgi:hypothetical protein